MLVIPSAARSGTIEARRRQCWLSDGEYHSNAWNMVWFVGQDSSLEEVGFSG